MLAFIRSLIFFALATSTTAAVAQPIPWQSDLQQASQTAAQTNRLVLVHFWAPWCGPCQRMEQEVFNQPAVAKAIMNHYVPVKLNIDNFGATARRFGISSIPTDVILSSEGNVISQFASPNTSAAYAGRMQQVAAANGKRGPDQAQLAQFNGKREQPARQTPYDAIAEQATRNYSGNVTAAANPDVMRQQQQGVFGPPSQPSGNPGTAVQPTGYSPQNGQVSQHNPYVPAAPQGSGPAGNPSRGVIENRYAAGAGPRYRQPAPNQGAGSAAGNPGFQPPANQHSAANHQPAPSHPNRGPAVYQNQFAGNSGSGPSPGPATQAGPTAPTPAPNPAQNHIVQQPGFQNNPYYQPPQQPAPQQNQQDNSPQSKFAMDGFCPVTLVEGQKWAKGDPRWGAVHRGQTFLFTGPAQQQRFLADPDLYSPAMGGIDPVLALDQQQQVAGHRRHGVYYRDRVYLFSSEESLGRFSQDPEHYVRGVRQAMQQDSQQTMR